MIDVKNFIFDCNAVGKQSPLVLNITNYVAMNFTANVLLAIGASPLMSSCADEIEELVHLCSSLVINIGCVDNMQAETMRRAAAEAYSCGKKWVLDPVGVGASSLRTETAIELIEGYHPSVIRGNASEISILSSMDKFGCSSCEIKSRGVDAYGVNTHEAIDAAKILASKSGSIVSVSGQDDVITDGERVETVANGSPLMTRVTAMGCAASALTGAFVPVGSDDFDAAFNAMAVMGIAGEIASEKCTGTGSFAVCFMDELSNFNAEKASKLIRQ